MRTIGYESEEFRDFMIGMKIIICLGLLLTFFIAYNVLASIRLDAHVRTNLCNSSIEKLERDKADVNLYCNH